MPEPRLALFDCDGTLVDSQANICRAMEEAFATADLAPPPRTAIRRVVGLSLAEVMRALLPDGGHEAQRAMVQGYRDAYQRLHATAALDAEPLFEGVADTLAALHADGWLLGVATGKSDRGLARVLAHHGLADLFVTLQTADRHPSKPDPAMAIAGMAQAGVAPHRTAMIGDTSFDMAMARAAGMVAVSVAWGYHTTSELADAGAEVIAEQASDLPALLRQLLA
jgi:phosphoglycolate phosphatase